MAKAPYSFDFRHSDFIGGTSYMSAAEVGVYIRFLCYQWANESLPVCQNRLVSIGGTKSEPAEAQKAILGVVLEKFERTDDGWQNKGLAELRVKTLERWAKNKMNGKKGGRPPSVKKKPNGSVSDNPNETIPEEGRGKLIPSNGRAHIPDALNKPELVDQFEKWRQVRYDKHHDWLDDVQAETVWLQLSRLGYSGAVQCLQAATASGWKGLAHFRVDGQEYGKTPAEVYGTGEVDHGGLVK